ncbi:MAG: hypothetical protein AAF628_28125 [Planctomycetota bacterium]
MNCKLHCCWILLVATSASTVTAQDRGSPTAVIGALAPDWRGARGLELPESSFAALAQATASSTDTLRQARLFEASRADGTPVFVARAPVADEDPTAWALVALTKDMALVAAAVTDATDVVVDEWNHLMEGLEFHDVPRLEGARPRQSLGEWRATAAAAPKDDEAQLAIALLDVLRHMNEQASVFNLPPSSDRDPAAESRMMSREFAAVAKLSAPLQPILGDAAPEFERLATEASGAAAAIADAAADANRAAIPPHQRAIMRSCKACHRLPVAGGQLKDATARARARLGIGDGYYQLGHDLRIRHPDRSRTQNVLDALRLGALLIDAHLGAASKPARTAPR